MNNSVSGTTSNTNTSIVRNLTRELDDRNLTTGTSDGNWRRELTSVWPSGSEVKLELSSKWPGLVARRWSFRVRSQTGTEEVAGLARGVGPSGSEFKLELKVCPELLRIGLLKYPGGWSFHPILRFCFSRIWPLRYFLISINFISCQFSSFSSSRRAVNPCIWHDLLNWLQCV